MAQIILSQSKTDFSSLLLGIILTGGFTVFLTWLTYCVVKYTIKDTTEYGFFDTSNLGLLFTSIVMTALACASCTWLINNFVQKQNQLDKITQSTNKIAYYHLKKDGVLIIAEKESNAPEWLVDNVKTKIISENKTTYQVQFKDQYARVNKKDLK